MGNGRLKREKQWTDEQVAIKVSAGSIVVNVLLSAFKMAAGIVGESGAMVSDALHSASDVFSTIVVIIGVRVSNRESDENHPYGHERLECVAAILLAGILCLTGLGIGLSGLKKILLSGGGGLAVPGVLPLAAAVISVAVKEGMYWYTRAAARRINSSALMADAWHHRSDALSSIGSFAGIFGARMGLEILDPLAGVVICLFIVKASWDIFRDAIEQMTDMACEAAVVEEMKRVVLKQEGVLGLDDIKTRMFGAKIYVDIEICADGQSTLDQAHATAERVHHAVEKAFPRVKHCMVHVNPRKL